MKCIILLSLLCVACAHSTPAPPITNPALISTRASCAIPTPPTAANLSAAQAVHGLIGRDALLTDYAKRAYTAKQACNH